MTARTIKPWVPAKVHAGDAHLAAAAFVLKTLHGEEGAVDKVYIVSANLAHLAVEDMRIAGITVVSPEISSIR
jgi:hypothetical protein